MRLSRTCGSAHRKSGLVLSALMLCFVFTVAQSAAKVRRIAWNPREPLASRLLPDDEIVVVMRDDVSGGMVSNHYLSVKEVIEDAAVASHFVVVVDADRVDGVLRS